MPSNYNTTSDSDGDEEFRAKNTATGEDSHNIDVHIQDIERLKQQSAALLDPVWKETRNKNLIKKMLDLEEPSITPKMVDFLCHDSVCTTLLSFVNCVGLGKPRPRQFDTESDHLKFAFKTTMLICPKEPTDALMQFLSKKTSFLASLVFDMFRDDSAGTFFHTHRLVETFFRCYPLEFLEGMCSEGRGAERVLMMLRYVGYPPVMEIITMILTLFSVNKHSVAYENCTEIRKRLFHDLREVRFVSSLVDAIVDPEKHCFCGDFVDGEAHSSAASHLFQELVEQLALEDIGETFFQPFVQDSSVLNNLIEAAVHGASPDCLRSNACKFLSFLLRRAADPEIVFVVMGNPGSPPAQNCIPNRLNPFREKIVLHLESNLSLMLISITQFSNNHHPSHSLNSNPHVNGVKYPGHFVRNPFTTLRSNLIEFVVLMVESDEAVAATISVELWKDLIDWSLKYAFNSIYHALFYRLVFSVLRQNQEQAQRNLFQKSKLASFLIDNYLPFPLRNEDVPAKKADETTLHRYAARGLFLNCLNAIRLQASCLSPQSFLRQFLNSHSKWNEFIPILTRDTDMQQRFGMGVQISEIKPANNMSSMVLLASEPLPQEEGGIDHGSRFARSLGFADSSAWDESVVKQKKKKAKKRKSKTSHGTKDSHDHSASAMEIDEVDGDEEDGDYEEDGDFKEADE